MYEYKRNQKLIMWFLILFLTQTFALPAVERVNEFSEMEYAIQSQGYQVETHEVTTEDGYILGMQRIPYARHQTSAGQRPVVFLMHGLFSSSTAYVLVGGDHGFAYNLADAGFDVWMGNARGNTFSRRHVSIDPDTQRNTFFDFTWDEIAIYDLPAMIDYVLEYTGVEQLHYIGHSQGGTVFLALNSIRAEYNEKIASAHLLAGVGYMNEFPDESLASYAQRTNTIYTLAVLMGQIEVAAGTSFESILGQNNIRAEFAAELRRLDDVIDIQRYVTRNTTDEEDYVLPLAGGGSLKQVAHYGQNLRDNYFRRYHHGNNQNLETYGTTDPPNYNLSLITVETVLHYSLNDTLLSENDSLAMAADMPNAVARKVARDSFDHTDYVVADDAKELVTDFIIESIGRFIPEDEEVKPVEEEEIITEDIPIPDISEDPEIVAGTGSASTVALSFILKIFVVNAYFLY